MTTTFNVKAAEQNLMQAIYAHSADFPVPLTPENCLGKLTISDDERSLYFTTNNLADVLAPMMFPKITIGDFGSGVHIDQPGRDGQVAALTLHFEYRHFNSGTNGCDFAYLRFAASGEIIEANFAKDEHEARMQEDPRYAKRFA